MSVASKQSIAAARALAATLPSRMPSSLPRGVYQHYKNRQLYHVLDVVLHTETEERMVLYQAMYHSGSNPDRLRFVRPLDMFTGSVVDAQGNSVRRFQLVEEDGQQEEASARQRDKGDEAAEKKSSSSSSSRNSTTAPAAGSVDATTATAASRTS